MTSDSFGNKILTFKEKMAIKKAEQSIKDASIAKPSPIAKEIKPTAKGRDKADDIDTLDTLLNNCDLTNWEKTFCKSCRAQLARATSMGLSEKQAKIVDKLAEEYLEEDDGTDPTPKGNPPAKFVSDSDKFKQKLKDAVGFDDMDDDEIPF